MLNNGVFGDTGGQMTAASVVGQRTKTSTEGRDPEVHGYPVPVADLIAQLQGTVYAARGAVYSAGTVAQTKKLLHRALRAPLDDDGLAFVEIFTMCPTGWFLPASGGPEYLTASFESEFPLGELALVRDQRAEEVGGAPR
jgi:2-oxoglutarate ferredoxin oxidoreductase subunit beta